MLTPFQKRKLARKFYLYDHRRLGRIGWQDVQRVLDNVVQISGWKPGSPERSRFLLQGRTGWQLLTAAADTDADGLVDLDEWYAFYAQVILPSDHAPGELPEWLAQMCRGSFDAMDANGDGVISLPEYTAYCGAWGIEPGEIGESFAHIDANGDGALSREEWYALSVDFYRGDDPKAASSWMWGDVYKGWFK